MVALGKFRVFIDGVELGHSASPRHACDVRGRYRSWALRWIEGVIGHVSAPFIYFGEVYADCMRDESIAPLHWLVRHERIRGKGNGPA